MFSERYVVVFVISRFLFVRETNFKSKQEDNVFYKKQIFPFSASVVSSRIHEEQRLPYRGCVHLAGLGLRLPLRGRMQLTIVSPQDTPVFYFTVHYDMKMNCAKRSKLCIRQQVKYRGAERGGLFAVLARPVCSSSSSKRDLKLLTNVTHTKSQVSQRLYIIGKIRFFFPCSDLCISENSNCYLTRFVRDTKFSEYTRLSVSELNKFSEAFENERRQSKRRRLSQGLSSPLNQIPPEGDASVGHCRKKMFDFSSSFSSPRRKSSPTSVVDTPSSLLSDLVI